MTSVTLKSQSVWASVLRPVALLSVSSLRAEASTQVREDLYTALNNVTSVTQLTFLIGRFLHPKPTISGEERATALRTVGAIPADFCVTKINQYSFCL